MPRLKQWSGNILLLAAALVVFFGGIELLLRMTGVEKGRPEPIPIYRRNEDPRINYDLKPSMRVRALRSVITTDSRGFRSPEPDAAKETIAVLGDSIVFGYGVEDDETVAARLAASLEHRYNVVNAGVPGYNLRQEAATYATKLRALDPVMLILVFYGNDLGNAEPSVLDASGNIQASGAPSWTPTCNPIEAGILGWLPGRCWLDLHSAFYRAVKKIVSARTQREQRRARQENPPATEPRQDAEDAANFLLYEREFRAFARTLPPTLRKLFVVWPDDELRAAIRPRLRAMAERAGFRVVDLHDTFEGGVETLSWDTVHPSAKTTARAAEAMKSAMEEHRLLP